MPCIFELYRDLDVPLKIYGYDVSSLRLPFRIFSIRAQRPPTHTTAGKMLCPYEKNRWGLMSASLTNLFFVFYTRL